MTAGEALITKIASTPGLTGTINVQFIAATTVGNNLIATTRQGDRRNIVHVGAHLDSVAEGPVSFDCCFTLQGLTRLELRG